MIRAIRYLRGLDRMTASSKASAMATSLNSCKYVSRIFSSLSRRRLLTNMFSISTYLRLLSLISLSFLHPVSCIERDPGSLRLDIAPSHLLPYVVSDLDGEAFQLAADVFRLLATNQSTAGAFSVLGTNGRQNVATPVHRHTVVDETFFCIKGRINMWVDHELRILGPHDFASVPKGHNHSYQFLEPDTQMVGFSFPGGFEALIANISTPYASSSINAPFPPDTPLPFPIEQYLHVARRFDVYLEPQAKLAIDVVNGSSVGGVWHNGNNSIPSLPNVPYYVASGWGPKYLDRASGQLIMTLATPLSTNGGFTMSTVAVRKIIEGEKIVTYKLQDSVAIMILEGELEIQIESRYDRLGTGDLVFIPHNTPFSYWSHKNWAKFLVGGNGKQSLDMALLADSIPWGYAVFPNHT